MKGTDRVVWKDGDFVPWSDATVHILAQSLQRGSLAFDYMRIHRARQGIAIFRLRDHVARLFKTCSIMGLPIAYKPVDLIAACAETARRNPGATSLKISALIPSIEADLVPRNPRVGVFICAYDIERDILQVELGPGALVSGSELADALGDAVHEPLNEPGALYSDTELGDRPRPAEVSLKVERDIVNRRPDIIPPQAKMAANYTSAMFAKWRAREEGFDEIVLLDADGCIAEAPTSNIFMVDEEGLATPPDTKVLHGITRATVIELAESMGIACSARDLTVADLHSAREVFLTSTSVGFRPVARIDRQPVSSGGTGVVTTRLHEAFKSVTRGENPDFERWLYFV